MSFLEFCSQNYADTADFDETTARAAYELTHPVFKTCVFVDDERFPTQQLEGFANWVLCRNWAEWVEYLSYNGPPDLVSFDHDLAEEHYEDFRKYELQGIAAINYDDFKQWTGLACAQYHVAFCDQNKLEMKQVSVHCTERPMGASNIRTVINDYKKSAGLEQDCFIAEMPTTTLRELSNPIPKLVSLS